MKAPKSSQKICDSVALPEVDRKMHCGKLMNLATLAMTGIFKPGH